MATLKYVDEHGNVKSLTQYKVNDIQIVQEVGENDDKVMSQKAVTDELNKILPFIEYDKKHNAYVLKCGTFGN